MSIKEYLHSKQNSWAPATLKTAGALLYKYQAAYLTGDPNDLWQAIQILKPYSRSTVWTHFVSYDAWRNTGGPGLYGVFRSTNANWFKNAYRRKPVTISFEEAVKRIDTLPEPIRSHCRSILGSGQRFSESVQAIRPDRLILGKGSKERPDFRTAAFQPVPYHTLYRALHRHGLSPHDLRKLAITRAAERGAGLADICTIAGWSSASTALIYLQPKETNRLQGFLG